MEGTPSMAWAPSNMPAMYNLPSPAFSLLICMHRQGGKHQKEGGEEKDISLILSTGAWRQGLAGDCLPASPPATCLLYIIFLLSTSASPPSLSLSPCLACIFVPCLLFLLFCMLFLFACIAFRLRERGDRQHENSSLITNYSQASTYPTSQPSLSLTSCCCSSPITSSSSLFPPF